MGSQRTFASVAWNGKGKVTRRERFLAEMDAVIPWPPAGRADRTALSKGRQRSPAAGAGEDAADLLSAPHSMARHFPMWPCTFRRAQPPRSLERHCPRHQASTPCISLIGSAPR